MTAAIPASAGRGASEVERPQQGRHAELGESDEILAGAILAAHDVRDALGQVGETGISSNWASTPRASGGSSTFCRS